MRFATPALAAATSLLLHPAAVDAAVLTVSPIEYPAGVPMQLTVSHDAPPQGTDMVELVSVGQPCNVGSQVDSVNGDLAMWTPVTPPVGFSAGIYDLCYNGAASGQQINVLTGPNSINSLNVQPAGGDTVVYDAAGQVQLQLTLASEEIDTFDKGLVTMMALSQVGAGCTQLQPADEFIGGGGAAVVTRDIPEPGAYRVCLQTHMMTMEQTLPILYVSSMPTAVQAISPIEADVGSTVTITLTGSGFQSFDANTYADLVPTGTTCPTLTSNNALANPSASSAQMTVTAGAAGSYDLCLMKEGELASVTQTSIAFTAQNVDVTLLDIMSGITYTVSAAAQPLTFMLSAPAEITDTIEVIADGAACGSNGGGVAASSVNGDQVTFDVIVKTAGSVSFCYNRPASQTPTVYSMGITFTSSPAALTILDPEFGTEGESITVTVVGSGAQTIDMNLFLGIVPTGTGCQPLTFADEFMTVDTPASSATKMFPVLPAAGVYDICIQANGEAAPVLIAGPNFVVHAPVTSSDAGTILGLAPAYGTAGKSVNVDVTGSGSQDLDFNTFLAVAPAGGCGVLTPNNELHTVPSTTSATTAFMLPTEAGTYDVCLMRNGEATSVVQTGVSFDVLSPGIVSVNPTLVEAGVTTTFTITLDAPATAADLIEVLPFGANCGPNGSGAAVTGVNGNSFTIDAAPSPAGQYTFCFERSGADSNDAPGIFFEASTSSNTISDIVPRSAEEGATITFEFFPGTAGALTGTEKVRFVPGGTDCASLTLDSSDTVDSLSGDLAIKSVTVGVAGTYAICAETHLGAIEQIPLLTVTPPAGPQDPPAAPAAPTVSGSAYDAVIAWTAPSDIGSADLVSFVLEVSINGDEFVVLLQSDANTFSFSYEVQMNTEYQFRVSAANGYGSSPVSAVTTFVPQPELPSPPTALNVHSITATSWSMSWSLPESDGGSPILGYRVQYREIALDGTVSDWIQTTDGQTGRGHGRYGIDAGISVDIRVQTKTAIGDSEWAYVRDLQLEDSLPGRPYNGVVSQLTDSTAVVSWKAPYFTGGQPISEYLIVVTGPTAQEFSVTSPSVQLDGLSSGGFYTIRITAVSSVGVGGTLSLNFVTQNSVPSAPTALAAGQTTATSVQFTWTLPSFTGGVSLESIQVAVDGDDAAPIDLSATSTSYTIDGLAAGASVSIAVRAVNEIGASAWTSAVSATAESQVPSAPVVHLEYVTSSEAMIFWSAPTFTSNLPIVAYRLVVNGVDVAKDNALASSHTFVDLEADSTFIVEVYASTEAGESASSIPLTIVTLPLGPPEAAVNVFVSSVETDSAVIVWSNPMQNGGADILEARIHLSKQIDDSTVGSGSGSGSGSGAAAEEDIVLTISGNALQAVIDNLEASTVYTVTVFLINDLGESPPSVPVTFQTIEPTPEPTPTITPTITPTPSPTPEPTPVPTVAPPAEDCACGPNRVPVTGEDMCVCSCRNIYASGSNCGVFRIVLSMVLDAIEKQDADFVANLIAALLGVRRNVFNVKMRRRNRFGRLHQDDDAFDVEIEVLQDELVDAEQSINPEYDATEIVKQISSIKDTESEEAQAVVRELGIVETEAIGEVDFCEAVTCSTGSACFSGVCTTAQIAEEEAAAAPVVNAPSGAQDEDASGSDASAEDEGTPMIVFIMVGTIGAAMVVVAVVLVVKQKKKNARRAADDMPSLHTVESNQPPAGWAAARARRVAASPTASEDNDDGTTASTFRV